MQQSPEVLAAAAGAGEGGASAESVPAEAGGAGGASASSAAASSTSGLASGAASNAASAPAAGTEFEPHRQTDFENRIYGLNWLMKCCFDMGDQLGPAPEMEGIRLADLPKTSTKGDKTERHQWEAIFRSGALCGDIIVRSGVALESAEVAMLSCGDIVEGRGGNKAHSVSGGVQRLKILLPQTAKPARHCKNPADAVLPTSGWVTLDATAVGGPVFFRKRDAFEKFTAAAAGAIA